MCALSYLFRMILMSVGLVGASTSGHLSSIDDCNVTVIIEDSSLLPGYGDKQVRTCLILDETIGRSVNACEYKTQQIKEKPILKK